MVSFHGTTQVVFFQRIPHPGKDFAQWVRRVRNPEEQRDSEEVRQVPRYRVDWLRLRRATTGCHLRPPAGFFLLPFFPLSVGLGPTAS